MTLFHGSTQVIEHPAAIIGEQGRDFGFAFYATDIRDQAERWARRRARYRSRIARSEVAGIVCEYEFDERECGDLAILRFQHINNQFAFCTEKAVAKLHFIRSYEVAYV